jgi:hypothetical protein
LKQRFRPFLCVFSDQGINVIKGIKQKVGLQLVQQQGQFEFGIGFLDRSHFFDDAPPVVNDQNAGSQGDDGVILDRVFGDFWRRAVGLCVLLPRKISLLKYNTWKKIRIGVPGEFLPQMARFFPVNKKRGTRKLFTKIGRQDDGRQIEQNIHPQQRLTFPAVVKIIGQVFDE